VICSRWNAQAVRPDLYFWGRTDTGGYSPFEQITEDDRQALVQYMIIQRGEEGKAPKGGYGAPIDPATHTPKAVITRMKADGARCVKTFYERGFGEVDEMPVPRLDTIRDLVRPRMRAHARLHPCKRTDAQEFAFAGGSRHRGARLVALEP